MVSALERELPAGLYFVATPIGSARDITLRALDILASADVLAAEDTRTLRRLMEIHGIAAGGRPMIAYHDHNGPAVRPRLLQMVEQGKSVAYASEAGTPAIADPGFALARDAIAAGLPLSTAPGPSAIIAALTIAGLPTDRFLFAGFPPPARSARQKMLAELAPVPATLVFYESPKRIHQTVNHLAQTLGEERQAALCRELTKLHEEVLRGTLGELARQITDRTLRGEIVLVVDRGRGMASNEEMRKMLTEALKTQSVKDAAAEVADRLGLSRRKVYQAALDMERGK